jgi:5-methylcytosine-specific restriction endonuclease McrA
MSAQRKKFRILKLNMWTAYPQCFVCQEPILNFHEATIEHVIPKSKGGTSKRRNLSISHKQCNNLRGNILCRIVWEYYIAKNKKITDCKYNRRRSILAENEICRNYAKKMTTKYFEIHIQFHSQKM